ncbi:MAG: histidinol-phosphate transaminase [Streptococcaceae bacterium]|jgi:histidinol-phosphate aminotransferase|nr:histidinol-phosphate transaminase [Streptococcaceae bacterium]
MSWQENLRDVEPYVSGEQPKLPNIIKLNTNENPYPPTPKVKEVLQNFDAEKLRLYPNADAEGLQDAIATRYGLSKNQVFIGNGSDEVLALSFLSFFNSQKPLLFPDLSYSFYPVYADLYGIPYEKVPVAEDFSLNLSDYTKGNAGGIIFPNPNAPTGLLVGLDFIESVLVHNPDCIVMIDEAYVDFGGVTAIPLLAKYDNLVITRTFSKSRSLAGIRLGVALGSQVAIKKLDDVKNSFNSYSVDAFAQAVGFASLSDESYFKKMCTKVIATRNQFAQDLQALGFTVTDSRTNFVFAKVPKNVSAQNLFDALYAQSIVVRHWPNNERIKEWLRITIGTDAEMAKFIAFLKEYIDGQSTI